jgi:hypothetical protein
MGTSLRITGVILFLVSVHLVVPKMIDVTPALSLPNVSTHSEITDKSLNSNRTMPAIKQLANEKSDGDYEPPNYGSPDSHHGSGTR